MSLVTRLSSGPLAGLGIGLVPARVSSPESRGLFL
jgi:hypothetical protein